MPAKGIGQYSRQESPGVVSFGVWSEAERLLPGRPKRS